MQVWGHFIIYALHISTCQIFCFSPVSDMCKLNKHLVTPFLSGSVFDALMLIRAMFGVSFESNVHVTSPFREVGQAIILTP